MEWVEYGGVKYKSPCVLIVGISEDEPVFACLEEIFLVSSDVYLKVCMLSIVQYSVHYHAYVVSSPSPKLFKLIRIDHLYSPFPLHPRVVHGLTHPGQHAVILKHSICVN